MSQTSRYYDDVAVGDTVGPIDIGPISTSHVVRFSTAVETFYPLHHDADWVRQRGMPKILVAGPFRHGLLTGLITQWAGPESFVRETDISNRGVDYPGTTLTLRGTLVRRWIEASLGHVEIETELVNSAGNRTCYGRVVVVLPQRGHGHVLKVFDAPEDVYAWAFEPDPSEDDTEPAVA